MNRLGFKAYIFGATLSVSVSLSAQAFVPADPSSLLTAKSAARAGSTSAASEQNLDGLLLNAASLAFQNQYAVSFGLGGMGNNLGASIVDTKSGPLGGGLYYIRRDLRNQDPASLLLGDYRRVEDRAGLSLFTKFSDRFALGISGKYLYQQAPDTRIYSGRSFNGDLSAAIMASPELRLSFTAQNLLEDKSGANPKAFVVGTEIRPSPAFGVSGQIVSMASQDLAANFALPNGEALGWSVGGFYKISNFELRAGYLQSAAWDRQMITGGLGYGDKAFSVDYAFQYEQNTENQFHGVSVTGYL